MAKINVSMPEEILKELDKAAGEASTTRSAFMVQAVQHALQEREEEKKRQKRRQAADKIIKLADEIGPWNGAAEVLKWRQKH